nr:ferrous iron transporter B [Treponema sp.]
WGNWQAAVASITGLVAKENIVGTMGILYGGEEAWANLAEAFTSVTGMSFLIFNLLCAPCFAAMGAIKREMNNAKWFWFAIGYECGFAYLIAFLVNQFGNVITNGITGAGSVIGLVFAVAALVGMIYFIVRKDKYAK